MYEKSRLPIYFYRNNEHLMEDIGRVLSNIHVARETLFCSILRLTAPFSRQQSEKLPATRAAYLTSISKLWQKRSIGSDAREDIQSVRSSYSQDNLATPDFPVLFYYYRTLQLRLFSLYLPWSRINTYTYQRWFIRAHWRPVGRLTRDPWSPEVTASSSFSGQSIWWESYRRAKIPWAVVHPCQMVINVSKDRYLLWSRCSSSLPLARPLAVFFPPALPFFSPSYAWGRVRSPSCSRMLFVFLPLPFPLIFIAEPFPSLSLSAPSSARGCRPSAVFLSVFQLTSLFSRIPSPCWAPYVFPDNAPMTGEGCVFWICRATRFSLNRNKRTRRHAVNAHVAWLLKFPHDVTTFRGIRSVKKKISPATLRERVRAPHITVLSVNFSRLSLPSCLMFLRCKILYS